jgi:hypothetical protein
MASIDALLVCAVHESTSEQRGINKLVREDYDYSLGMKHDDALAAVLLYCCEISLLLFNLLCFFVAAHSS